MAENLDSLPTPFSARDQRAQRRVGSAMSNGPSFLAELKRRNVYKVAVAYAVVGWLLMQIATQIFPFFEIPNWAVRLVVLVIIAGFPIALFIAWAFELTPEGLKRTEDATTARMPAPRRVWIYVIIGAAILSLGLFFLGRFTVKSGAPLSPGFTSKSIAVLPFQSFSKDEDNAFFADGVQDQILTNLSKVADLKVISRTSVMQYKNAATRNLREIAQQLGVAHVLEGSVQRAGGKVRVTAQLINALTDAHEWAENYDRPVDDVFAIQSEIAKAIADQLRAQISPSEKKAISQAPTTDLEANRFFVEAKSLDEINNNDPNGKQNLLHAEKLLNDALARDPKFLAASCLLVAVEMDLYFGGFDHSAARLARAKAVLDGASRLQPDAAEVHLARADYLYHGFRNYDAARAELELARRTLPNHANVPYFTALMDRRQGRWIEAERNFARTAELDPRNVGVLFDIGDFYRALRRYSESNVFFSRAVTVSPSQYFNRTQVAQNAFLERADVAAWRAQITLMLREEPQAAPDIVYSQVACALAERDAAAIARAVAAFPPEGLGARDNSLWPREWYAGLAARMERDDASARSNFAAARLFTEKTLREQPEFAPAWSQLGVIDAGLGRKDDAIREARRACELLPASVDSFDSPIQIIYLAIVYAWTGEKDRALEQLRVAARFPNGITYGELKLNPEWDALRGDSRFDEIVATLAPTEAKK